ncbi:MAG TPA: chlorite dismutase family protein [Polyangiaceae bacterium]|nr:chlorite dismutase family protein [Polyangiaceae bacterium]
MSTTATQDKQPGLPHIDVNEYGGKKDGVRQSTNRRLFMQLLVFDVPADFKANETAAELGKALRARGIPGVVYADTMSPRGLGLLTWGEDPSRFVREVRPLFGSDFLQKVTLRPDMAMIGRSYSTGHEPELEFVLLERPVRNVLSETYPWHVWYPLRRSGAFAQLEPIDQSHILREHAQIGMAYGAQELAHDIRLACHGLDGQDNEFVIGLVGRELHPLSHLVQAMRKTRQTSEFIAKMGPFFVGYVLERSADTPRAGG